MPMQAHHTQGGKSINLLETIRLETLLFQRNAVLFDKAAYWWLSMRLSWDSAVDCHCVLAPLFAQVERVTAAPWGVQADSTDG